MEKERGQTHSLCAKEEDAAQEKRGRNTHEQSEMEIEIGLSTASNNCGRTTTTQIVGYTNSKPESRVKLIARLKSWIKATVIHIPAEIKPLEAISPARCMHNQGELQLVREEDELTSTYASLCECE